MNEFDSLTQPSPEEIESTVTFYSKDNIYRYSTDISVKQKEFSKNEIVKNDIKCIKDVISKLEKFGKKYRKYGLNSEIIKECYDDLLNNCRSNYDNILKSNYKYISKLKNTYCFEDYEKVSTFINKNIDLLNILFKASKKINEYFHYSEKTLEIINDSEGEWEKLIIWVKSDLPPEKAFFTMKKFFNEWWLSASFEFSDKLSININLK